MITQEQVILVDDNDAPVGTMEKMEAHQKGVLHRAFSVFIFNTKGQLLMQQRALHKYHSGGKWTNTCCSHPRPGESTIDAAHRRLYEEMGMQCDLRQVFSFSYRAEFDDGLIEHEYDHVFFGICNDIPKINPDEVAVFKYMDMPVLQTELNTNSSHYTEWLKICFDRVLIHATNLIAIQ